MRNDLPENEDSQSEDSPSEVSQNAVDNFDGFEVGDAKPDRAKRETVDETSEEMTFLPDGPVKRNTFSVYFEWVEMFALYISIGLLILLLLFRHSPVDGNSMNPTLNNGDMLIVARTFTRPETGDIVVCQSEVYGLKTPLVKRVIAVGGQTVSIDYNTWTLTVDGKVLEEDYIKRENGVDMKHSDYLPTTFTVPEGYVFVMGDNRNHSTDSRFDSVGMIDERYILGKVKVKLLPFKDFKIY